MNEENKQPKGIEMPEGNPFANLTYEEEEKTPVQSYNPFDPFDFRVPAHQLINEFEEVLNVMKALDIRLGEKSDKWEQLVAQAKVFGLAPLVEE